MNEWADGSPLERRAAAAALCEPALLTTPERVGGALAVLAEATPGIAGAGPGQRRSDGFRALRKGLGYCWSVAVAAAPEVGRPAFEQLVEWAAASADPIWRGSRAKTCARGGWRGSTPRGSRGCSSASNPVCPQ